MLVRLCEEGKRPGSGYFVDDGSPGAPASEVLERCEVVAEGIEGVVWVV